MREGGEITAACLRMLAENSRPGVTTGDLDRMAEDFIRSHGGTPEFKGYPGGPGAPDFPGSICASPNAMIVHGVPGPYRLKDGDILSIDVGVRFKGFVTDSATTVAVGEVPEATRGLLQTTQECLAEATEAMRAGNRLGDVGHAIQSVAEAKGYGVVRDLVSHGVGRDMHEDPQIPNIGKPGTGPVLEEGMVLAVEPMVNAGAHEVRLGEDGWAVYSLDGSLAAHFEHTVAVTAQGPRILTPWHEQDAPRRRTASPRAGARA